MSVINEEPSHEDLLKELKSYIDDLEKKFPSSSYYRGKIFTLKRNYLLLVTRTCFKCKKRSYEYILEERPLEVLCKICFDKAWRFFVQEHNRY